MHEILFWIIIGILVLDFLFEKYLSYLNTTTMSDTIPEEVKGIYDEDWFEYNDKWFQNGGLRSHTQVRTGKFDVFPQKELIQMLNSL